jgi:hypothetical protein
VTNDVIKGVKRPFIIETSSVSKEQNQNRPKSAIPVVILLSAILDKMAFVIFDKMA